MTDISGTLTAILMIVVTAMAIAMGVLAIVMLAHGVHEFIMDDREKREAGDQGDRR